MDDDFFVSAKIDEHRTISISSISSRTYREIAAEFFPSDKGYFICEHDSRQPTAGISILAKVASLEAAYRLADIWGELTVNPTKNTESALAAAFD